MIFKALSLISSQLNEYIEPLAGDAEVIIGNIALHELPDQNELKDKVVVSVINIEEEATLKNYTRESKIGSSVRYFHHPVHMNLYLLFTANYPQSYDTALIRLSSIIRFFQHRHSFDIQSAQPLPDTVDITDPDDMDMLLKIELCTLTFEQINYLWGTLGGKQMPFVLYKARLVTIQENKIFKEGGIIEEIRTDLISNSNDC
jgi:hypothetical protein